MSKNQLFRTRQATKKLNFEADHEDVAVFVVGTKLSCNLQSQMYVNHPEKIRGPLSTGYVDYRRSLSSQYLFLRQNLWIFREARKVWQWRRLVSSSLETRFEKLSSKIGFLKIHDSIE
jgi:hypothetical protein